MKHKLSVLITCKDEEHNIRPCIESALPIADEVLVADSGSTDATLEIVREIGGCRIVEREYVSDGDFKNWAIPQASHRWVLVIDSDERVSDELAAEIRELLSGEPQHDGYRIRFETYVLGHQIKYCGWNTTSGTRLFRRDVSRYNKVSVHADVVVSTGKVGQLTGKFLHYTCPVLAQYMSKVNRYTSWSVQDMYKARRRVTLWGLLLRPPLKFLQMYLYRGGILDGVPGLIVCIATSYYTFMKYAKLWELQNRPHQLRAGETIPQPYRDEEAGLFPEFRSGTLQAAAPFDSQERQAA